MGYGNYSHAAHEALTTSRASLPRQEVFKQRDCHALMNPKGVKARESRDSAEHPNSLAIAFALDVTGSMGDIPDLLARRELPSFMKLLQDLQVADPQVLFTAVGDANSDRASLQVGQFESKAELMDQWLTWSFLEGAGGSFGQESYELALYFLAEHTDLDCRVKRGQRGYLFMTGDENPYPAVSRHQVEAIIGDKLDEDVPTEAVVAAVQESFHPFFLIPDLNRRKHSERRWRDLLGDHVICMESPSDTCAVAAGIVALGEKRLPDLHELARTLGKTGISGERVAAVVRALSPFAALLGKDGLAGPHLTSAPLPSGGGESLWNRLKK